MRTVSFLACGCLVAVAAPIYGADPAPADAVRAAVDADGVQRIRVVAGSYFFNPRHIVVKAGARVELTLVKEEGLAPHNFVLRAPETGVAVDKDLSTEPTKVTFTPSTRGRYAFHCSNKLPFVASHRERGMEGILEVVD